MTAVATPPARNLPGRACLASGRVLRTMACRLPIREVIGATLLVFSTAAFVHAEDPPQDWLPAVLAMPGDAEVVTERAIGSSVRLFTISTAEEVDPLFEDWEASLRENGYQIIEGDAELLSKSLEFTGSGIANAKIILAPTRNEGRSLIEFDATLE